MSDSSGKVGSRGGFADLVSAIFDFDRYAQTSGNSWRRLSANWCLADGVHPQNINFSSTYVNVTFGPDRRRTANHALAQRIDALYNNPLAIDMSHTCHGRDQSKGWRWKNDIGHEFGRWFGHSVAIRWWSIWIRKDLPSNGPVRAACPFPAPVKQSPGQMGRRKVCATAFVRSRMWCSIARRPLESHASLQALRVCDVALIPVLPSPVDLWASLRLPQEIDEERQAQPPQLRAYLVLNQVEPQSAFSAAMADAVAEFGLPVLKSRIVRRRAAFRNAALDGVSVYQMGGRGSPAAALTWKPSSTRSLTA
jgi:hypothetical protein